MARKSPVTDEIRLAGLDNIDQLADITTIKKRVLYLWFKNKPQAFKALLAGAVSLQKKESKLC